MLVDELRESPFAGDGRWLTAPPWVVALMTLLGVLAWAVGARQPVGGPVPAEGELAPREL